VKDDQPPHTCKSNPSLTYTSLIELNKDLKDIKSHEWYSMYGEISTKLEGQLEDNKKLHEDLMRRQERYIKRE
jgi:hypothetical protein